MSANDELQAHTCEKILQEYGKFANNVAQGNSQDLTEQWKKGELESGWYYINNGQIDYKYSKHSFVDFFVTPHEDIKEVLAPVPSYEDWQKLQKNLKNITDSYKVVAGRCTQLEKFLEEFDALKVAEENEALKTKLSIQCEANEELRKENQHLKDVISKMCMELVDPDDNMSNGLAEWFNQDLLLEIREVLK